MHVKKKITPRARNFFGSRVVTRKNFFSKGVPIFRLAEWADGQVPKSFNISHIPNTAQHVQPWAGIGKYRFHRTKPLTTQLCTLYTASTSKEVCYA